MPCNHHVSHNHVLMQIHSKIHSSEMGADCTKSKYISPGISTGTGTGTGTGTDTSDPEELIMLWLQAGEVTSNNK